MPPLRSKPICKKCNHPHWGFVLCENVVAQEQTEQRNEQRRRDFIIKRPREGYAEWDNRIDPQTELMGSTFAIRRQPGERHGGYRS